MLICMQEITLTQSKVAIVDDDDYEWLIQWTWYARKSSQRHPGRERWYAGRSFKSRIIHMHRVILDAPKGLLVDHINGNGLDNQKSNLRLATNSQNICNSRLRSDNTSGYRGVSWNSSHGKWVATAVINGKQRQLGSSDDPVECAKLYDETAYNEYGEFALLNFPNERR